MLILLFLFITLSLLLTKLFFKGSVIKLLLLSLLFFGFALFIGFKNAEPFLPLEFILLLILLLIL